MHATGFDTGRSDNIIVLIGATAGGSVVTVILILVGILIILTKWLYKKHHSNKNLNSSAFDPDTAATVEMDDNPSYGIINKDSNPIKMNSDPLYHLPTDSSDGRQMGGDHSKEAHKKKIVLMETDPIYQSTIRDDKLHGFTNFRREIGNENYNHVEPYRVVRITTEHHNDINFSSPAPKPYRNHDHIDPDKATTVIMDYNPSCGKDNSLVKMNTDPSYQLSTDPSYDGKTGEDHKVPSQRGAVQMETDPIYQPAVRDDKLYGVTNGRREISKENYYYVEPDEVVQYNEDAADVKTKPSTGGDSGNYKPYIITIL